MRLTTLATLLLFGLALSCGPKHDSRPAVKDATTVSDSKSKSKSKSTSSTQTRPTNASVKLPALKKLPKGNSMIPKQGYPGTHTQVGAFLDQASFDAFATLAGDSRLGKLTPDFSKEVVLYVVFDGQTNSLRFLNYQQTGNGSAKLTIQWDGIEPYYPDWTPGVFVVVPRDDIRQVAISTDGGLAIGTIKI